MKDKDKVGSSSEQRVRHPLAGFSIGQYILGEINPTSTEEWDSAKYHIPRDRVHAFLSVPMNLERFMAYGNLMALDHFLHVYTLLPLRVCAMLLHLLWGLPSLLSGKFHVVRPHQVCDFLKLLLILVCTWAFCYLDTSILYHKIRSQSVIKLYIFFNLLDVSDRLLSAVGQDALDSLSWTVVKTKFRMHHAFRVLGHIFVSFVCMSIHAFVILLQTNILNVALNSHNKSILTIMLSNNFVEVKGSVFKRFAKNNLFQMACSDVRERFHLVIMLGLVVFRNLSASTWYKDDIEQLFMDILLVLVSEVIVDWVKHAFIAKFNDIQPNVFSQFSVSLSYDVLKVHDNNVYTDYFDQASRRVGLTPIPLSCIINSIAFRTMGGTWFGVTLLCAMPFLIVSKLLLHLLLRVWSFSHVHAYEVESLNATQAATNGPVGPPNMARDPSLSNMNDSLQQAASQASTGPTTVPLPHYHVHHVTRRSRNTTISCSPTLEEEEAVAAAAAALSTLTEDLTIEPPPQDLNKSALAEFAWLEQVKLQHLRRVRSDSNLVETKTKAASKAQFLDYVASRSQEPPLPADVTTSRTLSKNEKKEQQDVESVAFSLEGSSTPRIRELQVEEEEEDKLKVLFQMGSTSGEVSSSRLTSISSEPLVEKELESDALEASAVPAMQTENLSLVAKEERKDLLMDDMMEVLEVHPPVKEERRESFADSLVSPLLDMSREFLSEEREMLQEFGEGRRPERSKSVDIFIDAVVGLAREDGHLRSRMAQQHPPSGLNRVSESDDGGVAGTGQWGSAKEIAEEGGRQEVEELEIGSPPLETQGMEEVVVALVPCYCDHVNIVETRCTAAAATVANNSLLSGDVESAVVMEVGQSDTGVIVAPTFEGEERHAVVLEEKPEEGTSLRSSSISSTSVGTVVRHRVRTRTTSTSTAEDAVVFVTPASVVSGDGAEEEGDILAPLGGDVVQSAPSGAPPTVTVKQPLSDVDRYSMVSSQIV